MDGLLRDVVGGWDHEIDAIQGEEMAFCCSTFKVKNDSHFLAIDPIKTAKTSLVQQSQTETRAHCFQNRKMALFRIKIRL
jgi:hypothetical protein